MLVNFDSIKDIPAYIISTDKNIDRFERSKKILLDLGFTNIERWKGLDAETEEPYKPLKDKNVHLDKFKNKGEMSCALAHIEILENIVKNNEAYRLVFEDDIIVHSKFHEYINDLGDLKLTDFDVLFLGGWFWSYQNKIMDKRPVMEEQGNTKFLKNIRSFETHAYLATNTFARKILEKYYNNKKDKLTIDIFYSYAWYTRKYLLSHSPIDSENLEDIKAYNENNMGLFYQRLEEPSEIQQDIRETNIKHSGGQWIKIDDECTYDFTSANILKGSKLNRLENIPESGILILKNGIYSHNGIILNENHQPVIEHSWFGKAADRSMDVYLKYIDQRNAINLSKITKLKGKCLNLDAMWANKNTGHFLMDSVSKLDLLKKSEFNINYFDYIIVPNIGAKLKTGFALQDKYIKYLDIPKEKLILIDKFNQKNYQFDELYDLSLNGKPRYYRRGCFDFYIDAFNLDNKKPFRKLYVKREDAKKRNIENLEAVENLLRQYNFEFINCEKLDSNVEKIFNEASIIVGSHGAGLSHCCFSQKGTKLIEFIPEFHQFGYYMSVADANGMEYTGLHCSKGKEEEHFVVNCSLLNDILIGNL